MSASNRTLIVVSLSLVTASAMAFTLDLSYAGGYLPSTFDNQGNQIDLFAPPISLSSTSTGADVLANRMVQRFGYTVSRGTGISGIATVDKYQAQWESGNPYNRFGSTIDLRLNTTEDLSVTRWIVDHQLIYNGNAVSDDLYFLPGPLNETDPPFYFSPLRENQNRNGSNSFGPFSYRFYWNGITSRFLTGDPHTEGSRVYAFLVTVNSSTNFTIREGVVFGHDARVVPEPATLCTASIAFLAWHRRKRRNPTSTAGS